MFSGDTSLSQAISAGDRPFAIVHRPAKDRDAVEILIGAVVTLTRLDELAPLAEASDVLALLPYRQIRERGFSCNDDAMPLLALVVKHRETISRCQLFDLLPVGSIDLSNFRFDISDRDYQRIVKAVIANEIGAGEGSNFVISRSLVGSFGAHHLAKSLALFRRLLTCEHGAYWTFLVHTGTQTFVGATPEAHLVLNGGEVVMNPISGTYRYPKNGPTMAGISAFLADQKETDELFMVVDEELKMMSRMCPAGGVVSGPFLKEMAHLAHTEYFIHGRSDMAPAALLRETMFAPTVMGSPLENACRVIARYEPTGRGYYSGVIALVERGPDGDVCMDSAILIRTAVVDESGRVRISVGSTLVRNSDPKHETSETRAKAAALVGASRARGATDRAWDAPVAQALAKRNEFASPFWLSRSNQHSALDPTMLGKRALLVDAEDHFTAMLATMLGSLGLAVETVAAVGEFAMSGYDLVVFGPGPGDPTARHERRISALHWRIRQAIEEGVSLLAVCLSHQILCQIMGLELERLDEPNQGVGRDITLFGRPARVGFYNTFVARCSVDAFGSGAAGRVDVSRDAVSGEVYALRAARFESIQFHAESILSRDGRSVLANAVQRLLSGAVDGPCSAHLWRLTDRPQIRV